MPSVADLGEKHLLQALTDADTYEAGARLADLGAVEFEELGPLRVRARVLDGEVFTADLRSGIGQLVWSCSEIGGSRGALCRHGVAAAIEAWRRSVAQPAAEPGEEPEAPPSALAPSEILDSARAPAAPLAAASPPTPAAPPPAPAAPQSTPEAGPAAAFEGLIGIHAVVFTPAVAEVRTFFGDVLGLRHVDAGRGWPIFALPPAELAVHPADVPSHELYLMCDDIEAALAYLERRGVEVRRPVREQAWGLAASIVLSGGTELTIYQPAHPSPQATDGNGGS